MTPAIQNYTAFDFPFLSIFELFVKHGLDVAKQPHRAKRIKFLPGDDAVQGKQNGIAAFFVEPFQDVRKRLAEISESILILVTVVAGDDSDLGNLQSGTWLCFSARRRLAEVLGLIALPQPQSS